MDTQNKTVECTFSATVNNEIKNIRIRHNERVLDARIKVDDKAIEVKSQKLPSGAALHFEQDGANIIVTIIKENAEYAYDCFVNEVSIKDDMPWKLGKYEFPEVLKWEPILKKGMVRYTLIEAAKGLIVGLVIFLFLILLKVILPDLLQNMNLLVYFLVSIFPLSIFYALLSPGEFKAGTKSMQEYNSYRGEKAEETEIKEEINISEDNMEDISVTDVDDIV